MVQVLRVETKTGIGPYQDSTWGLGRRLADDHSDGSHPSPKQKGEPWEGLEASNLFGLYSRRPDNRSIADEYCGFLDIEQMISWFSPGWRKLMDEAGFVLAVYECEEADVFLGEHQITFRKRDAKLVLTMAIGDSSTVLTEQEEWMLEVVVEKRERARQMEQFEAEMRERYRRDQEDRVRNAERMRLVEEQWTASQRTVKIAEGKSRYDVKASYAQMRWTDKFTIDYVDPTR